jgi:hypothetical protein
MDSRLPGFINAIVASLTGSCHDSLMPEGGGRPATGSVAGVASERSRNMGEWFSSRIDPPTGSVACTAIARCAAEYSLNVAGLAQCLCVATSERETGG